MRRLLIIRAALGMSVATFRFIINETGSPNAVLALFGCDLEGNINRAAIVGRGAGAIDLHTMIHERKEGYHVVETGPVD